MSVFDASLVADALVVAGPAGDAARSALHGVEILQVPEILTAEVTSAVRSMVLRGQLEEAPARFSIAMLRSLRKLTYPIEPFLERVWELRHRATVYDAWYLALAEHLSMDLVTADERMARIEGVRCRVRLPV